MEKKSPNRSQRLKDSNQFKETSKTPYISAEIDNYITETIPDDTSRGNILKNLVKSPLYYYLRVNLTRISAVEVLEELKKEYPDFIFAQTSLENMISIEISANFHMKLIRPIVYCDKFAAESVMMGANLYVPGVCEIEGRFPVNTEVSIMLDPQKIPASIQYEPRHYHVANGIAKIASKDYPKYINGLMVSTTESKYRLPPYRQSKFFESGWISDHHFHANLSTLIFSEFIMEFYNREKREPVIFDTCSAPGHKTCGVSEWLYFLSGLKISQPQWFHIISIDRSKNRLEHLKNDIERLGLKNIDVVACKLEKIDKKYPNFIGIGDFVYFDPPCSALGPRPKLFVAKSSSELMDYSKNQRRLLKIVDRLVKPGGYLMYNTCTFAVQENEGIIAYALTKLNYEIVPIPSKYLNYGNPGLEYEGIPEDFQKFMRRFYPNDQDGQGYFIALLRKKKIPDSS